MSDSATLIKHSFVELFLNRPLLAGGQSVHRFVKGTVSFLGFCVFVLILPLYLDQTEIMYVPTLNHHYMFITGQMKSHNRLWPAYDPPWPSCDVSASSCCSLIRANTCWVLSTCADWMQIMDTVPHCVFGKETGGTLYFFSQHSKSPSVCD